MTRPSLAGIEKRTERSPMSTWTAVPALTAVVRDVLALHQGDWSCGNPAHTNPDVGCPECGEYCADCDQTWPCATVRALAAHLDLTDPEGDPT